MEFALQKGFDPLVPENWDKINVKSFVKQVGNEYSINRWTTNVYYSIGRWIHELL